MLGPAADRVAARAREILRPDRMYCDDQGACVGRPGHSGVHYNSTGGSWPNSETHIDVERARIEVERAIRARVPSQDKLAALESAQEAIVTAAVDLSDKTAELMISRSEAPLGCLVVHETSYLNLREAVLNWRRASDAATAQARGDDDASVAGAWRINVHALHGALRAIREHRELIDLAMRDLPKPTRGRSTGLEITIDALAEIVEDDWRPRGEPSTPGGRPPGPVGLTGEFHAPTLGPDYKCPVKDCTHDHSKTWQAPPGSLGCIPHDEEVMRRLSTNVRWVGR
jgi:hypothetical protein